MERRVPETLHPGMQEGADAGLYNMIIFGQDAAAATVQAAAAAARLRLGTQGDVNARGLLLLLP